MRKFNFIAVIILLMLSASYTFIDYLEKVDLEVQHEAYLNAKYKNVTYSEKYNPVIYPYSYSQHEDEEIYEEVETIIQDPGSGNYPEDGLYWLISKTQDGTPGRKYTQIQETLDLDGNIINEVEIPYSEKYTEMTPTVYSYGSEMQEGAYFYSAKTTQYGVDCAGCGGEDDGYGNFAVGVTASLDSVQQQTGQFEYGVQYEGYYIIATSQDIPLCTIVEVSNHGFSGQGISKGEPFLAIVLDRGGVIKNSRIDFYIGSEYDMMVSSSKMYNVRYEIVDFNSRYSANGLRGCNIQYDED